MHRTHDTVKKHKKHKEIDNSTVRNWILIQLCFKCTIYPKNTTNFLNIIIKRYNLYHKSKNKSQHKKHFVHEKEKHQKLARRVKNVKLSCFA